MRTPVAILLLSAAFAAAALGQDAESLRKLAAGKDSAAAVAALLDLEKLGAEKDAIAAGARDLLVRDRAAILSTAGRTDVPRSAAILRELQDTRAKAIANLQALAKGEPIDKAKQFHAKLKELLIGHNAVCALRWQVIEALRRRQQCIAMLNRIGAPPAEEPADARMAQVAAAALAIPLDVAIAIPELGDIREPHTDAPEYPLWFHRACRQVDAWNKAHSDLMNKWESIAVRFLNEYREALGLKVLEIDPRLVQSARQHSKEMSEKDYFSHLSPTPDRRTTVQRMRKSGYIAGWRENIAKNVADPERVFWLWFGSPGHHVTMIAPEEVAVGVGRWDNSWTLHLGHGERLMLKTDAGRVDELAQLNKSGDLLKPQPDNARLPPVTITRTETDITIIDPKTGERATIPGKKEEPKK